MRKIRDAQITLTMKELIVYVFVVHKLFIKRLSEKQIIKLTIRSLGVNLKKKIMIFDIRVSVFVFGRF